MKYRHILYALFFFTVAACKKNSSEKQPEDYSQYYIKAKIEGEWVTFPGAIGWVAPIQNYERVKTLISAAWTADSTRTFSIIIGADGAGINSGVYHNENMNDDTTAYFDTQYNGLPHNQLWRGGMLLNDTKSTYTFTITSITDKVISGYFEGDFAMDLFDPNERLNIPEGEFRIRRIPFD